MSGLVLDLSKKFEVSLEKAGLKIDELPKLEVRLAMDHSGSMDDEYRAGLVDRFINLFIPAGMKFDDNQSVDMGFFHDRWIPAPPALVEDAGNYLARKKPRIDWGGTNYAPIVDAYETRLETAAAPEPAKGGLFGMFKKAAPTSSQTSKYRGYAAVITDGKPNDPSEFEAVIDRTSGDTFFEWIAIGTDISPHYLTKICERYPHTHFSHLPYPKTTTDEQFYDFLCNEKFVAWAQTR